MLVCNELQFDKEKIIRNIYYMIICIYNYNTIMLHILEYILHFYIYNYDQNYEIDI